MYRSDWPELQIGDVIEVKGELVIGSGERRIKTKNRDDIKVIGTASPEPPTIVDIEQIDEEIIGSFIMVGGQVIEIKGQNIYVDDGSGEIRIYINPNTNINKGVIREGDFVQISGILSKTKSGLRILPWNEGDIVKTQVLAASTNLENNPNGENSRSQAMKYLIATILALVVVLAGLTIQIRKKSKARSDTIEGFE